jgi:hypothetical protein
MKIRSGFVSNSSSSSFVLFGVELGGDNYESLCRKFLPEDKLNEAIKEYGDDIDWNDMWYAEDVAKYIDLDVIHGDGEIWIGKEIASGGDYMENGSLSFEEMKEYEKEIKEVIPDAECKLHYGTYPC